MITHGAPLKAFSLQPIYLSSYTDSSLPNYSGVAQLARLGRTCPRSGARRARGERRRLTNLRLQVSTLFPLAKLESESGSVVLGWIEIPSHRSAPA